MAFRRVVIGKVCSDLRVTPLLTGGPLRVLFGWRRRSALGWTRAGLAVANKMETRAKAIRAKNAGVEPGLLI